MSLLPLLILALLSSSAASPVYVYNLTFTLANGNQPQSPLDQGEPYYYLLNQNIFPNSTFQSVVLTNLTLNGKEVAYSTSTDEDGNVMISINSVDTLSPGQNATLFMSFRAALYKAQLNLTSPGNLSSVPESIKQSYPLTGTFNVSEMPNGQEIINTAYAIKGDEQNVLQILLSIAKWFEDNMIYSSELSVPRSVSQTFADRAGDCDDQANLYVAFCRILGIPAYTTIGPIYSPGVTTESEDNLRFNLTNAAWHGWAMAYLPGNGGQWVPVDLTFFSGAIMVNGHIRSTDLMQLTITDLMRHITGSAIVHWDTLEYYYIRNLDYVTSAAQSKENITSADIVWVEEHYMQLLEGQPSYPSTGWDPISALLLGIAAFTLIVFALTYLRHRSRAAARPFNAPPLRLSPECSPADCAAGPLGAT